MLSIWHNESLSFVSCYSQLKECLEVTLPYNSEHISSCKALSGVTMVEKNGLILDWEKMLDQSQVLIENKEICSPWK